MAEKNPIVPAFVWDSLDSDRRYKNEQKARAAGLPPCEVCGRGLNLEKAWMIEVIGGGYLAHRDEHGKCDSYDPGYMGCFIMGPECGRKIPAANRSRPDSEFWDPAAL